MSGTSPLRRAREEVAVNIAVTGFVSRLLPSRTKALEQSLQSLRTTLRDQEKDLTTLRRADRDLRAGGVATASQLQASTQAIANQQNAVNGLRFQIQGINTQLRDHQGEMRRALTQVRGWGIAVGTTTLLLGGMSKVTLGLASDIQTLELQAFRADTSLQSLQRNAGVYSALFGNLEQGREAAKDLAEFNRQIQLFSVGAGSLNIGALAQGLTGSTVGIADFLNVKDDKSLQQLANKAVAEARGDVRRLSFLQQSLPENVFNAAVLEQTATPRIRAIRKELEALPSLTAAQIAPLREMQAEWGLTTTIMTRTKESILVGLAPSLNFLFDGINLVTGGISALSARFPGATKVVGGFVVITLTAITVIGTYALVQKGAAIANIFFRGTVIGNIIATKGYIATLKGAIVAVRLFTASLATNPVGLVILGIGLALLFLITQVKAIRRLIPGFEKDLDRIDQIGPGRPVIDNALVRSQGAVNSSAFAPIRPAPRNPQAAFAGFPGT